MRRDLTGLTEVSSLNYFFCVFESFFDESFVSDVVYYT